MIQKILLRVVLLLLILFGYRMSKPYLLEVIDIDSLGKILGFIIFVLVITLVKEIVFFVHRKGKDLGNNETDNIISGLNNIHIILLGVVGFLTMISLLGVDVKNLFASLSIIAAAIAIISKDYISNVIAGMLIAFSNDVNVGDSVRIGTNKGKVIDLSITMLSLLTDDDDVVIIPNSMVYALDVRNYSKLVIKKTSIEFEMDLEAISTVGKLEEDLIATLKEYHEMIHTDSYSLKTAAIKKDYVEFKFQYILNMPDREKEIDIRRKVIRRVIQIIKKDNETSVL